MPASEESGQAAGRCFPEYVLVLEGRAREAVTQIGFSSRAQVISAAGAGDDTIVRVAASLGLGCVVVTADRELRRRCEAVGAGITGPGWILGLL
jgi:hypothetical protein